MFQNKIFSGIPNRVSIRNAHAAQTDIFGYEVGEAAEAFIQLAQEVVSRG
jgi:cellulose biosynthesis protein BcsQ